MIPIRVRRSLSIVIPLFSAAAFLGIINSIFKVSLTENLYSTGVTLGMILAILNGILLFLVYKHQVP